MSPVRSGTAVVVCDQWLGSNGYAGMKALRRAGWAVSVVPEWEYVPLRWGTFSMRAVGRFVRRPAVREFNRALINEAQVIRADMLLVFKGTFVAPEAVRQIRAKGSLAYNFFPDNSFRAHGRYLPRALPEYDWVYTAKTFGLRDMEVQLGIRTASLLLHGFDPDLHRMGPTTADDEAEFGADVSFIGAWSPKKEKYLAALASARPDIRLRIWGPAWERSHAAALQQIVKHSRSVVGERYVRAIRASRINLAILSERRSGSSADDQITSRTFHIPASGGFMLHERTEEVLRVLEEDVHIGCFGNEGELVHAVQRWLGRPAEREAVARAGHEAVVRSHSWDHRIAAILEDHAQRRMRGAFEV